MKNVSMIAAIGQNNELGKDNKLIWDLPNDLKFFKNMTMDKEIIMGSNTFYSLPKLLPGRKHIVLTRKNICNENIMVINNTQELIEYLKEVKKEVMIIGGASVYNQMLEYADKLYLTQIEASLESADAYFPQIDYNEWNSELLGINSDNGINYKHLLYKRKK